MIKKHCDMHKIKFSKSEIRSIINLIGKHRQSLHLHGKKIPNIYPKMVRNVSFVKGKRR